MRRYRATEYLSEAPLLTCRPEVFQDIHEPDEGEGRRYCGVKDHSRCQQRRQGKTELDISPQRNQEQVANHHERKPRGQRPKGDSPKSITGQPARDEPQREECERQAREEGLQAEAPF